MSEYITYGRGFGRTFSMGFLRMLAHFDALDGDDDPPLTYAPYETIHRENSFEMPDLVRELQGRLWREFGSAAS